MRDPAKMDDQGQQRPIANLHRRVSSIVQELGDDGLTAPDAKLQFLKDMDDRTCAVRMFTDHVSTMTPAYFYGFA